MSTRDIYLDEINSSLCFELKDYLLIYNGRYYSNDGGLIIYIHDVYKFKHVNISSEIYDNDETKPS